MADKRLQKIKDTYRNGTRVELEKVYNIQAPPKGTQGTVIGVDDNGDVQVLCDNGQAVPFSPVIDICWILFGVTTQCYGEKKTWTRREDALAFFLEGMLSSEGSEQERYSRIYSQLKAGENFASDEL